MLEVVLHLGDCWIPLGLSTGRVCAQPGLHSKLLGGWKWNPKPTKNASRIVRFGSRRVSVIPIGFRFCHRCRYLARFVEIWPDHDEIWLDHDEISPRSCQITTRSRWIWTRSRRDLAGSSEISSNFSLENSKYRRFL